MCHIQALERPRQENHKFKINLSFIVKLYLKKNPHLKFQHGQERKNTKTQSDIDMLNQKGAVMARCAGWTRRAPGGHSHGKDAGVSLYQDFQLSWKVGVTNERPLLTSGKV